MSENVMSDADRAELTRLETALWQSATRFDRAFMDSVLAEDFLEFGRSGRRYDRQAILDGTPYAIDCELPLPELELRPIAAGVVLVAYTSRVIEDGVTLVGRRSSLWSRAADGRWVLRFHQGTPLPEQFA